MMNNVYMYYYDSYIQILESIKKEQIIRDVYLGNHFDRYRICTEEQSEVSILIYKNNNILSIICEKYKDILRINIIDKLEKINMLDKEVFNAIFKSKYSENLCKLVIDIDIVDNNDEIIEFTGHNLLNFDLLREFNVQDINSDTKLKSYSIQPLGYRYMITFKSVNRMEFNKRYRYEEVEDIINKFVNVLEEVSER